jgi:hypothetical protein
MVHIGRLGLVACIKADLRSLGLSATITNPSYSIIEDTACDLESSFRYVFAWK